MSEALAEFSEKLQEMKEQDPNKFNAFLEGFMDIVIDIKQSMGISSAITNVKHAFTKPEERFKERLLFELEKALGPTFYAFNDQINQIAMDVEGFFLENAMGSGIGGLIGGLIGIFLPGSPLLWGALGAGTGAALEASFDNTSFWDKVSQGLANAFTPGGNYDTTNTNTPPLPTEITLLSNYSLEDIRQNPITAAQVRVNRARRIG